MALVNSFMPKTMLQMPIDSKPYSLLNNKSVIIRCAAASRRQISTGKPPQINRVSRSSNRSLRSDQVSLSNSLSGEDGKTNGGNVVADEVKNTTNTADATD
ncbi:hypothetical protein ACFX2J_007731 [Malus domestica]